MDLSPVAQLIVVALAAARVTVLVVDDAILDMPRGRLLAAVSDRPYLTKLLTCHLCSGWWIALAWTVAWIHWPAGTAVVGLPFAVAALAAYGAGVLVGDE